MNTRTLARGAGILAAASLGTLILGIAAVAAQYLIGLTPVKVTLAGRVVDNAGRGIGHASVDAKALPITSPESESAMEPPSKRKYHATSDANGRFRLERVIAGVNAAWDKGGYVQEYELVVSAEGYRPLPLHMQYDPGRGEKHILIGDIVLEKLP